jgi:hypothetical protein
MKDESLWSALFLQEFSSTPVRRLATSWRGEYIQRFKIRRVWHGGHQLGCYRFRDIGGVKSAQLSLDRRSLIVTSPECIVHGTFAGAKLSRSAMYYSRTFDDEAIVTTATLERGRLALGLDNGSLVVYDQIPTNILSKGFSKFIIPCSDVLPVQRIDFISRDWIVILCRRGHFPTCRLIWWDISKSQVMKNIEGTNINAWNIVNRELVWSAGGLLKSSNWESRLFETEIDQILFLSGGTSLYIASLGRSSKVIVINYTNGVIERRIDLGGDVVSLTASRDGTFIIAADISGSTFRITPSGEVRKFAVQPVSIKAIAADATIILVLLEDSLLIYDGASLEPLQRCPIPSRIRRVSGPDIDATGEIRAEILSFDKGRILIRWGTRNVHFWNFGPRIAQLDKPRRSIDRTPRLNKADVKSDLEDGLDAYHDARDESRERRRIIGEFALADMNEAEMLQYAQMLSLGDSGHTKSVSVSASDDDDIRLAKALSLSEHHM